MISRLAALFGAVGDSFCLLTILLAANISSRPRVDYAQAMKHQILIMNTNIASPPSANPFLQRVLLIIDDWVAEEWGRREAIRNEAAALGWNNERTARYRDTILTAPTLACRVDGMSEAKLRRELEKVGAPTPGELIRKARIRHAAQLLIATRLLVKEVAHRAGYENEKHFTDAFRAEYQATPSDYRRTFINGAGENHS